MGNRKTLGYLSTDMVNIDVVGPTERKDWVTEKVAAIMAVAAKHHGYVDVFAPISDDEFGYHLIFAFYSKKDADAFKEECPHTEKP